MNKYLVRLLAEYQPAEGEISVYIVFAEASEGVTVEEAAQARAQSLHFGKYGESTSFLDCTAL